MSALTPEQIQEGKRLHEAAAPGPWSAGEAAWFRGRMNPEDGKRPITTTGVGGTHANAYGKENAELIAWMRTNLPALLAAAESVGKLEKQVDGLAVAVEIQTNTISSQDSELSSLRAQLTAREQESERLRQFVDAALTESIQRRDVELDKPSNSISAAWMGGEVQAYSRIAKQLAPSQPPQTTETQG